MFYVLLGHKAEIEDFYLYFFDLVTTKVSNSYYKCHTEEAFHKKFTLVN